MRDLGDGWRAEWYGPEVITLIRGDHRVSFDVVYTGRHLWRSLHTIYVFDSTCHWDPPHEKERLCYEDAEALIQKLRRLNGGWLRRLFSELTVVSSLPAADLKATRG